MSAPRVLLVDDDAVLLRVMAQAFSRRGYEAVCADSAASALTACAEAQPGYAVVDLRMPDGNGLQLIPRLLQSNPALCIVVLTGFASIATAVEAVKLGAHQYLTKPADVDDVIAAFGYAPGVAAPSLAAPPTPLGRLEWEYIQKVLIECDGNVSAAAKRLGLHRRTLQRKLQKRPSGLA
ncbi:MAG TPA: response regulator transcription factor [Gammaproteobacteria bacterium]|nr:response regulator transcription factor [Gammaproteobacteria bacterium]